MTNYIHQEPLFLLRVKGSHREIGRQIGEARAESIKLHVENTRTLIETSYSQLELDWNGAQIQSRKYIPFAQERYPQYVEEMVGIAEGAGVSFDDVAVINALEAVTIDALHLTKCTSMAVNDDGSENEHVLVAHNEDWLPEDEPCVYLLHVEADDEPPIMAVNYGAFLPNTGFNGCGLAQCCDTVYTTDCRIGVPRAVVARAVLAARTPEDAIRRMLTPRRAAGYNHLLAHESGELYNVEVSARKFGILYAHDNYLVHTNHFLDPGMQPLEKDADTLVGTRLQYYRALRLLRKTPQHTIKTLQAIQRDHVHYPNSICNHVITTPIPLDREKTVCAMIIDITTRTLHATWGNPCENAYHTFYLDA